MGARKAWSAALVLAMLALGVSAGGDALLGAGRRVGAQHRRLQVRMGRGLPCTLMTTFDGLIEDAVDSPCVRHRVV